MTILDRLKTHWLSLVIPFAAFAALWRLGEGLREDRMVAVASVMASTAGMLLGFLLTAVTLLTAVMDRTLVANMRKTGHYQRIMQDSFNTCAWLLAVVVLAISAMFMAGQPLFLIFCITVSIAVNSSWLLIVAGVRFSRIFSLLQ